MINVLRTDRFDGWMARLRDDRAKARIADRIMRLASGNPGDHKSVGGGVMEMRIDYGPGYRVYYTMRGSVLVILLCGGAKATQKKDIVMAKAVLESLDV